MSYSIEVDTPYQYTNGYTVLVKKVRDVIFNGSGYVVSDTVSYDVLYDSLVQFESYVLASKAKKAANNHDLLALLDYSNASLSESHANSSYLPQPYYVMHPSLVIDYEDEYQGKLQRDSQEDKLTTAMMLLARAITQKFSTSTNNHLLYGGNGNWNARRQNRNQAFNVGNGNDDSNQIVQLVPRTKSTLRKPNAQCYNCNEKANGNADIVPSYDAKSDSEKFKDPNLRESLLQSGHMGLDGNHKSINLPAVAFSGNASRLGIYKGFPTERR
nr:hypothetical protein [Tanacetum cinerariifolium]